MNYDTCRVFTLAQEQRKRGKRPTECDACGRLICRNEYYHATVTLYLHGGRNREIVVKRICSCSPYG
jgi:hypothetical protein